MARYKLSEMAVLMSFSLKIRYIYEKFLYDGTIISRY